jgi:DNA-binding CsgD family transcriptional regulator
MLRAATAAFDAGLPHRSEALLDQARPEIDDPLLQAEATRLEGRLQVPLGRPPAAPALLVAAARAFAPLDRARARTTLAEAIDTALVAQQFTVGTSLEEIGRLALAIPREGAGPPELCDLLLDGLASLFTGNDAAAMPILREGVARLARGDVSRTEVAANYHFGVVVINELWDDEAYGLWCHRSESVAREHGALIALQVTLLALAKHETRAGRFAAADAHYDETIEITRAIGGFVPFYELLRVDLNAWRGREDETRRAAARLAEAATGIGSGGALAVAQLALAALELGTSRYADALAVLRPLADTHTPGSSGLALPLAVEAAVRSGDHELAERWARELHRRATTAGTPWGLGLSARSQALVAPDNEADALYREALSQLGRTSVAVDLAHTHLLYGEWLRRQGRRDDARTQLATAHDTFSAMGADAFGRRAHGELAATGQRVRRRTVETQNDLTAQEAQVARLASTGATNPEIAASLFISANTVDYHLRKVYRKLGITSRRQLANRELHGRWTRDPSSPPSP